MSDLCNISKCGLPAGHDGRHHQEGVGFFQTQNELRRKMPHGEEFRIKCQEFACGKCKGKGEYVDVEDECMTPCMSCHGSGLKGDRRPR